MTCRFTEPQRRALLWLPANGGWSGKPGKMAPALDSLFTYCMTMVDMEQGRIGPRGGWGRRFRLTALGIEARKGIEG